MAFQAHILGDNEAIGFSSGAAGNECHKAVERLLNGIGRSVSVLEVSGIKPPEDSTLPVHIGAKKPLDENALWVARQALEQMGVEVYPPEELAEAA